eukprot:PhM_4_TR9129/c0_g1_i1/m.87063
MVSYRHLVIAMIIVCGVSVALLPSTSDVSGPTEGHPNIVRIESDGVTPLAISQMTSLEPASPMLTDEATDEAQADSSKTPLLIPPIAPYVATHEESSKAWLVVIGIPTVDTDVGARRRRLQRSSWLKYKNIGDTILVKYLVGLHPSNGYTVSDVVKAEAEQHKDIIVFDMREGRPTTGKTSGGKGYWGLESEVGMSRKAYAWYCYAATAFPHSTFIMKSDDDVFLRSLVYERILRLMPTRNTYWGKVMDWGAIKGKPLKFPFAGGMGITLSMDLVRWISTAEIPARGKGPFVDNRTYYKQFNMDHEDVMVGRWFFDAKKRVNVFRDCRFHDVNVGANVRPLTDASICVHHVKENEYASLYRRFGDDPVPSGFDITVQFRKDAVGNNVMK